MPLIAKILAVLQKDGALTQRDVAEAVGLSQNACWRKTPAVDQTSGGDRKGFPMPRLKPLICWGWI